MHGGPRRRRRRRRKRRGARQKDEKSSTTRSTIILPIAGVAWFLDLFDYYIRTNERDVFRKELLLDTKHLLKSATRSGRHRHNMSWGHGCPTPSPNRQSPTRASTRPGSWKPRFRHRCPRSGHGGPD